MKKLYLCAIISLLFYFASNAQGIYQFWGVTPQGGGQAEQGTLFSTRFDGTGIQKRNAFEVYADAVDQFAHSFELANGKIYGFFPNKGPFNYGILYEFDPATSKYTVKLDLHDYSITSNAGFMYTYNNKLYGIGYYDGTSYIYEYDPAANTLQLKKPIDSYARSFTFCNNLLYGATFLGGANDEGYIFRFDPISFTMTKLMDVPTWCRSLYGFQVYNNRLYGVGSYSWGILAEYDPATNQITKKADITDGGGRDPILPLRICNGKIYGTTRLGLIDDTGVVFEFDPVQNKMTKKMDITDDKPMGSLQMVYNNRFYGVSGTGGNFGKGLLYEYDPASNTYTKKIHFNGAAGSNPLPLMVAIGNKIYGLSLDGGYYSSGCFYEYDPATNIIDNKFDMGHSNGSNPFGKLLYYQGKLYGFTTRGGNYNKGVIYSYDIATGAYAIRYHMNPVNGYGDYEGSLILYNGRMYGVARFRENSEGGLFEFNPAEDQIYIKHTFTAATGGNPTARLLLYNNKLYGTTRNGGSSDGGVLYEFDPATNVYSVKVHFSDAFGTTPIAALTSYKGKLYGSCSLKGLNDKGTLFVYDPAINGFQVKHHFNGDDGYRPASAMVVYNDKLYGTTDFGDGNTFYGAIYELDPVSGNLVVKHKHTFAEGSYPHNDLLLHNKKLFGLATAGGDQENGSIFEYDLQLNKYTRRSDFNYEDGRKPYAAGLTAVPALVAPGIPGTCQAANAANINAANANEWIAFTDKEGNAVMEINPNGNILGSVRVNFYTHDGATRKDEANRFYLDRNITVSVEHQPTSPVSVRLYIKKTEYESLKNTVGAGVQSLNDITVFKNDDPCSKAVGNSASPVNATVVAWGLDYVYLADINSFSSFYFASKAYTSLPIKLEYFKGTLEQAFNNLEWKAACTDKSDFIVERSADGGSFSAIGMVWATASDCDQPFSFRDQQPLPGKGFYRIQMKDEKGLITYSQIIILDRSSSDQLSIRLHPNPVQGGMAQFHIASPVSNIIPFSIVDAAGRVVLQNNMTLIKGSQYKQVNMQQLPAGVYTAVFYAKEGVQTVRMVKR